MSTSFASVLVVLKFAVYLTLISFWQEKLFYFILINIVATRKEPAKVLPEITQSPNTGKCGPACRPALDSGALNPMWQGTSFTGNSTRKTS